MNFKLLLCVSTILICSKVDARTTYLQSKTEDNTGNHKGPIRQTGLEEREKGRDDLERSESAQMGYQYFNQNSLPSFLQDIYKKTIPLATGQFFNPNLGSNLFNPQENTQTVSVHYITLNSLPQNSIPNYGFQSFGQSFGQAFGQPFGQSHNFGNSYEQHPFDSSPSQSYGIPPHTNIGSIQESSYPIPNPHPLLTHNNPNFVDQQNTHNYYNKDDDVVTNQVEYTTENLGSLYTSKPLSTTSTTTALPMYDIDVRVGGRN